MPLGLLGAIVAGGLVALALLMHKLGFSRLSPVEDAEADWLREWPDDDVRHVITARSGEAALVRSGAGWGLVWRLGADRVARRLTDIEATPTADGVQLILHDFTAPHVHVALETDEIKHWIKILREHP